MLSMSNVHQGGCACGQSRYEVTDKPVRTRVCHCRYCQLRSGSPFGVGVWFNSSQVKILKGNYKQYNFTTESGNDFQTNFCENCGSSVFWTISHMKDMTAIAGASFDPPAFWYDVTGEIFTRSKAPFVQINCQDHFETSPTYKPVKTDEDRFDGNKK